MGHRSRIWFGARAALLAAAAPAGCGSSGTGGADPATLAPASTPLYVGVTIEPSGGAHGPAVSDVQQLTRKTDPYGSLAETLLAGDGLHPRFASEVRPWAGRRAGVFLLTAPAGGLNAGSGSLAAGAFASGKEQGAIVLDVSDASGARRFIDRRASLVGARGELYRGVRFEVSSHGGAMAIVGGFAVVGSEAGVKSAIDSLRGAPKLSDARGYLAPTSDAIANAYLLPGRLGSGALNSLLGSVHTAALLVKAAPSSLSLEGRLHAPAGTTSLWGEASAQQLQALPGGSWLALGLAHVGSTLPRALALLTGASGDPAGHTAGGVASTLDALGASGVRRLLARLGSSAKLRRSFERWAGGGRVFISGSGLFDLQAALVIDSNDPAASRSAVAELAGAAHASGAEVTSTSIPGTDAAAGVKVSGFPATIYVASGQGKLVVGLGRASVLGALHSSSTLAGSPTYAAAASALGADVKPSLILEFPALLSLLEAIGVTQSEALAGVLPNLKSLGRLSAGSSVQEDRAAGQAIVRVRAVLELASGAASG
ncbi:MAG: hypothetical protein ACTHM1_10800 [Solirubrobacteraceae bacterium]